MNDRRCTVCMVFRADTFVNFSAGNSECNYCKGVRNGISYREKWLKGSMGVYPFEMWVKRGVLRALSITNERIELTARLLGLGKATLHRWIKKWKRENTYQLQDVFSMDRMLYELAARKKEWRKMKSEAAKIRRQERRDAKIIKLADKAIASEQRKRARREASRLKGKKHVADSSSSLT